MRNFNCVLSRNNFNTSPNLDSTIPHTKSTDVYFIPKIISKTTAFLLLFGSLNSAIAADNPLKKDWDIINYDPNKITQTGSGVILGIVDAGFPHANDIESLQGQMLGYDGNISINYVQAKGEIMMHGSQVAGILLGKKIDENKPYGMAYGSKFYGVTYLNPTYLYSDDIYNYYEDKNVKIINNSWGDYFFPNIDRQITDKNLFSLAYKHIKDGDKWKFEDSNGEKIFDSVLEYAESNPALSSLMKLSKEGVLMVRSAGNDGMAAPTLADSLPTYDEDLRAWLVVGAIDSANAIKNSDGSFTLKEQKMYKSQSGTEIKLENLHGGYIQGGGITTFSNGFQGTESYSLLAPGTNISLVNPYYGDDGVTYWKKDGYFYGPRDYEKDQFVRDDGTSFAAPMVSAAAALVAEKYPFLSGAQLADVLLSTANNNITLPKIIVKVSGKSYYDDNTNKQYYYYDVIYVNPTKKPDTIQAKDDLKKMGFSDTQVNHILSHLFDGEIRTMTKEELIGQGILDVQKALNGLAKLDANRLNAKDIDSSKNTQALYTIDTKGYNAEFGNDISQVLWVNEWHNSSAANYPAGMDKVKYIGLIKDGEGELTLSSKNNTYEGDTIVKGGTLKLSGKLEKSNVFAEKGGTFLFYGGEVVNNATAQNGGFINIESNANKVGRLVSQSGGTIWLKNSGSEITITNGVSVENNGILQGVGTINGNLVNNGIVKAGFSSTSDSIDSSSKLTIKGDYTQESSGELQLLFTKDSVNNSTFSANSYTINGGSLVYVPIQSADKVIKIGDSIQITLPTEIENAFDKLQVSVQNSNNILEFSVGDDNKTITAKQKPNAFQSNDSLATALSDLFARKISDSYNDAFATLDTMPHDLYEETIKSLRETPHDAGILGVDSMQKTLSVKSTLFTLNPDELSFAPTAALGGDYMAPGYMIYTKTQFSGGLTYRRANASDFKQNSYLLDLQAKKPIDRDTTLNSFIGIAQETSTKDSSEIKSNIFSAGLGVAQDFGAFGVLGSVSAGFSNNTMNQSIINLANTSTSADYNSYFFHAQGGIHMPIWLGNFGRHTNTKLSPIAMLDFTSIYQDSFTQSGGLFAKRFDKNLFHNFRSWLGLNFSHVGEFDNGAKFAWNVFGFYWHNFNKPKDQNLSFVDASDVYFTSGVDIGQDGIYLGLAGRVSWDRLFIHTSIGGELAKHYNQIELMLRLGLEL
ncbi:S8 family serine peptidase [Helicobacter equorum]|uniref:OMP1316 n=1 Tax=Helicobacter equorum TaxID=361872 RepID=A0A1M4NGM0_9HELI|nr:S8 family serine peptidase [Helicobacter equorum]SFZ71357.1 OMP1316 [Helicobacter equorum]